MDSKKFLEVCLGVALLITGVSVAAEEIRKNKRVKNEQVMTYALARIADEMERVKRPWWKFWGRK